MAVRLALELSIPQGSMNKRGKEEGKKGPLARWAQDPITPLHLAAYHGQDEVIREMIMHGVEVTNDHENPVQVAIIARQASTVRYAFISKLS